MAFPIEVQDQVAVVRIVGAGKANVQNDSFIDEVERTFDLLEREHPERAVILTAEGSVFSAGLDFESIWRMFDTADEATVADFFERYRRMNLRVWSYPRPTVAGLNGHAFAGGLILALACDHRIGARPARYALNEVPIGIPMPAAYVELIRHATGARGGDATLFGLEMDAAEALRRGFLDAVCEPSEVLGCALAVAGRVDADCMEAYAYTKRALQAPARARIDGEAAAHDRGLAAAVMSEAARRARARRYQAIKGRAPEWRS